MNIKIDVNDSIFDLSERYPEVVILLKNVGMEEMEKKELRETLGKSISLRQALTLKQVNVDAFIEELIQMIEEEENAIESSETKGAKDLGANHISIQGVLPCPIRVPLLEEFEKFVKELDQTIQDGLEYKLQAASAGVEWIKEYVKEHDAQSMPVDLFISAGFDLFFDHELMGKYKASGVFLDQTEIHKYNEDFSNETTQLQDPDHEYSILGVVPAVFLINSDEMKGRSVPKSWKDILDPKFENSVSLPIGDFDLFNAILLNIYKVYGEEGIQKLGKCMLRSMHPSEMVRSHRGTMEKPAITIMPYFFTRMARPGSPMKAVWPEDGAIISPIFMLSKKAEHEKLKPFIHFFASQKAGEIMAHQGLFPSVHPEVDNQVPKENQYMWLGWDYINSHDIGALIKMLEKLFYDSMKEELK